MSNLPAGMIYAPYIVIDNPIVEWEPIRPRIMLVREWLDRKHMDRESDRKWDKLEKDWNPKEGIKSTYATKMINQNFYGVIKLGAEES